jgi:hypothetical protein
MFLFILNEKGHDLDMSMHMHIGHGHGHRQRTQTPDTYTDTRHGRGRGRGNRRGKNNLSEIWMSDIGLNFLTLFDPISEIPVSGAVQCR